MTTAAHPPGSTDVPPRVPTRSPAAWRTSPALRDAVSIAAVWLVLAAATTTVRPDFLSKQSLLAVTFTMAISGILSVAQGLVVIGGGLLDLSLPVTLVLSAWVTVQVLGAGLGAPVAVPLGILTGAAWGLMNGLIVVFGKLNPIIVTLATGFGGLAAMLILFKSAQVPSGSSLREFGLGRFLGLPNAFWPMVVIVLLTGAAFLWTRWARRLVAVGGNPAAARARGISLRKARLMTFGGAGAVAGTAGVLYSSVTPSFTPNAGSGYQLIVIAAVILAGISLSGGTGNFFVLLLSVGFLSTIPVSIAFFGLAPAWAMVFQGGLLIAAVGLDGYRLKRGAR